MIFLTVAEMIYITQFTTKKPSNVDTMSSQGMTEPPIVVVKIPNKTLLVLFYTEILAECGMDWKVRSLFLIIKI